MEPFTTLQSIFVYSVCGFLSAILAYYMMKRKQAERELEEVLEEQREKDEKYEKLLNMVLEKSFPSHASAVDEALLKEKEQIKEQNESFRSGHLNMRDTLKNIELQKKDKGDAVKREQELKNEKDNIKGNSLNSLKESDPTKHQPKS
jgi:hypothetical protein